jgi:hypothetical protein
MKVPADEGYLDSVCDELILDNVNPNLLVLDPKANHDYVYWRSGIFFAFSAASQERHNFLENLFKFLYLKKNQIKEAAEGIEVNIVPS